MSCDVVSAMWAAGEACRRHAATGCRECLAAIRALLQLEDSRETGRKGGASGRGPSKRRGDSEHYRALAAKRKTHGRQRRERRNP